MRQSPLLTFTSSSFPIVPDEDARTNPGIYGQSLAGWVKDRLRARGLPAGEVFAEDFGWCVPVELSSCTVYVACASGEERPDRWQVFGFVEGGLLAKLLRRDTGDVALATVFAALKESLSEAAEVRELHEEG